MFYKGLKKSVPQIYRYMQLYNYQETWSLPERYVFLDSMISKLCVGKRVVETGCCSGVLAYDAAFRGAKFSLGFDFQPQYIETANRVVKDLQVDNCVYEIADATKFDYSKFDLVLCLGLLYNISDEDKHLVLERMSVCKEFLVEFWCLCDDVPYPTTTKVWVKNGGYAQHMPNKIRAEQLLESHGYSFQEVTPKAFANGVFHNRFYLCKRGKQKRIKLV